MTTKEGLTQALEKRWERPQLMTIDDYRNLRESDRLDYNIARSAYTSGAIRLPTENGDQGHKLLENLMRANVHAPNRSGMMIDAEPHMGKTTLLRALMEWTHQRYRADFPQAEYRGHVPIVYVEAQPDTSGKALATALLAFFGGTPYARDNTPTIINRVIGLMRDAGTHLVCIDEFHNIAANNVGNGQTVDYIKSLHNEVEATFVISGIEVNKSKVLTDTPRGRQLRSRFTKHGIKPYRLGDATQQRQWQQLLLGFERELPLLAQQRNSILQFQTLLMKRTSGNIGALHKLLTRIAVDLIWADHPAREALTADHIISMSLDIASEEAELIADAEAEIEKARAKKQAAKQQRELAKVA
ncbi:TniB family NTP-binding protein [Leifsonia naganoensis]|uniref:AAA family ATPase n=1 Tax=Leifsonia naganoensis TaxID=150025 RepID=A0A853DIS1_9MICO|nr:TniB family NTP-binding protein [Leifsonia naganoensis]NYK09072.1 hypothetical protein [Leifsonia naganoensis]